MPTSSAPTREQIAASTFRYTAHYNLGRLGYGYGYTSQQYPRVSLIDKRLRPTKARPGGEDVREWYVDGKLVPNLDAVVAALASPPVLSDDEERVLALIPTEFVDLRALEDDLAGVERPSGGIRPETPHSRVLGWLHSLAAKGLIEHSTRPWTDEEVAAFPGRALTPEHLRTSPTVRRHPR